MLCPMLSPDSKEKILEAYSTANRDRSSSEQSSAILAITIARIYNQGQKERPPVTMGDIGKLLDISRQRVSQLVTKGEGLIMREMQEVQES